MKLLGNASVYLAANILNAAIPFLLLPILTRLLSPAEYGTIAMFFVMTGVFSAFTGLSVHGVIGIRYLQLSPEEFSEYVASCIGLLVVSTAAVVSLLAISGDWLVRLSGLSAGWLKVAVVVSALQFLISIRLSIWQSADMVWHYGSLQVSRSLLDAALTLVLLLGLGMAWEGRLIGTAVATVVAALVALGWLYRDRYIVKPHLWVKHVNDALRFGLPLIPHTIGGMLLLFVDRVVINQLLGAESVGIYVTAVQMGMLIGLLTESFNKAYSPWLFRRMKDAAEGAKLTIVKGTYIYFLLILLIGAGYGLAIPFILPYLVGREFVISGELMIYVSLGFSFGGCYYMVANYIFLKNRTEYLALITFCSGVLNIPLTYVLVKEMELKGAAVSYLIVNLIVFIGTWILAARTYSMPWLLPRAAPTGL
jgi:O-antigen/teichoic acid export membrane protein